MIIKKNKLDLVTGAESQPAERSDVQSAQVEFEYPDYKQNTGYTEQQDYPQEPQNLEYNPGDFDVNTDYPSEVSVQKSEFAYVNNSAPIQNIQPEIKDDDINLFDLDNIDFSQRQERRRGDRRRGFRRVDDRNLVSRAREEADAIRVSAQNEGYEAGLMQAKADIDELKNSLGAFMNSKQEVFEYIAPDILEISVDIAQKIVKKEIEQDPQVIFNTIVDVLKTLSKEESKVTLRVNPTEVNEVKQAIPKLLNLAGIDAKVVILPDEGISEGGCIITTTNGIVDATIESRIKVVTQALKEL